MRVQVRLAEPYWRVVGQRDLELALEENALVADLLATLQREFPALAREMAEASPHIFIADMEADLQTPLEDGDLVHLVWPVAGG